MQRKERTDSADFLILVGWSSRNSTHSNSLTALPANGDRSELFVNASFGLGEAVVGGYVTPDTFTLDRTSFESKRTVIGAKEEMIVSGGAQGTTTQPVPEAKRNEPSLSQEFLSELAALSMNVERLFDGLATDIGGILAHGAIVAREYGIPAVMGTGNVTRRIVSGQRTTVDGDTGTVTILK